MKIFASAVAAVALIGSAGAVQAAQCTTKFLTGVWVGTAPEDDDPGYCIVQFKTNGWITEASCFDPPPITSIGTMKGRFTVNKSCAVTGNFDFYQKGEKKINFRYEGKMNPKKGVITGTLKPKNGEGATYDFVQQWN